MFKIENREIKYVLIILLYVAWKGLTIALIPMGVGLSKLGGFESESVLTKFMFYIGPAAFFTIATVALLIFALFYFKDDEEIINGVYILNPRKSIFPHFLTHPLNLFFIPLIFFSFLGVLTSLTGQQSFIGTEIPITIEQQFTPTADIFFAVYPASPAEQSGLEFLITLLMVMFGIAFKKFKLPKDSYILYTAVGILIIILASIVYGVVNHQLRYGFDERSVTSVILFWGYDGGLMALTGSFIPGQVTHDVNNFYEKIGDKFSDDTIRAISILTFILIIIIYVILMYVMRNSLFKLKVKEVFENVSNNG